MKTMGAGAFKAKCLSIIDDVHANGGELIITKRGKPMAKLVPIAQEKKETIFGALRGLATIEGDIVSPIVEPWEWDEDIFPHGAPPIRIVSRRRITLYIRAIGYCNRNNRWK